MGTAGTSLIEVLVAVMIFLMIVVGLGSSTFNARRTEATSRFRTEATTLAVDKLEHLRALLLVDGQALPGTHVDSDNPLRPRGTTGGIYNRTWRVTQNIPVVGMRRVDVTVSWNDRMGPGSLTLSTYLGLL